MHVQMYISIPTTTKNAKTYRKHVFIIYPGSRGIDPHPPICCVSKSEAPKQVSRRALWPCLQAKLFVAGARGGVSTAAW